MNLGQRVQAVIAALSGQLGADIAANTSADSTFREQTQAAFLQVGVITTDLNSKFDALQARVEAGETIDPAEFAEFKATIASLNEAFPDPDVQPPEEDEPEDPIVDDGSAPTG